MADQPMMNEIDAIREELTKIASRIKVCEMVAKPPVVQELVLARRHAEDARMRLGCAGAFERGLDPWANKFNKDTSADTNQLPKSEA